MTSGLMSVFPCLHGLDSSSGVARERWRGRAAPGGTPEGAAFSDNNILILSISLQQRAPSPHNCCTSKHNFMYLTDSKPSCSASMEQMNCAGPGALVEAGLET